MLWSHQCFDSRQEPKHVLCCNTAKREFVFQYTRTYEGTIMKNFLSFPELYMWEKYIFLKDNILLCNFKMVLKLEFSPVLFWYITLSKFVISYWRFVRTHLSYLETWWNQRNRLLVGFLDLQVRSDRLPETSIRKSHCVISNIKEHRMSYVLFKGGLTSRTSIHFP